jgi:hypothetical protein
MNNYFLDPIAVLACIRKSSSLTHAKWHYLKDYDYVVGPKADGERMFLFGGGKRNECVYLISPAQLASVEKNHNGRFVSMFYEFLSIIYHYYYLCRTTVKGNILFSNN